MMAAENKWIDYTGLIDRTLKEFVYEVQLHPYNFLSESDVKCKLFMMLYRHKEINRLKKTLDGRLISPLHSEVSYFNDKGKLLFHVDLSIIDPKTTDVYSKSKKMAIKFSKEYRAGVCYSAIEIKFNRRFGKDKIMEKWEKDWEKLEDISTRNQLITCYSILLDKKNRFSQQDEIVPYSQQYPNVKIVYTNTEGKGFFFNF